MHFDGKRSNFGLNWSKKFHNNPYDQVIPKPTNGSKNVQLNLRLETAKEPTQQMPETWREFWKSFLEKDFEHKGIH